MNRLRLCVLIFVSSIAAVAHAGRGGQLTLLVTDRDTGAPIACRMHLKNIRNQPNKPPKAPFWHDHFVFDGSITLTLPSGDYNFEIERGPEYLNRGGHFTISDFAEDTHAIDLKRVVDMRKEGWWSGDLFVDRPEKDMPLILEAEDVHVAQLVGKPAKPSSAAARAGTAKSAAPARSARPGAKPGKAAPGAAASAATAALNPPVAPAGAWTLLPDDRCFCRFGLADSRAGNLFIFANLNEPPAGDAAAAPAQEPIWDLVAQMRRQKNAWVDAGRAFSWDLPLLVAEGQIDSVELANSHLGRASVNVDLAGGKPHDKVHYPGPAGMGHWSETIYYHLLNCGLRIPPSAGSGSGVAPNPVGYDRMYVQLDGAFTVEKWWEGFKAGRVVVTNGPLLRPMVEGEFPGHLFQFEAGEAHDFEIGVILSTREPIDYLEIVQNGEVANMVRLDEWVEKKGQLPRLTFTKSGWFVVRAITNAEGNYRFASSGPYYVSVGDAPRVSKASAQFFVDWIDERVRMLPTKIAAEQRAAAMKRCAAARAFWQALVEKANAE